MKLMNFVMSLFADERLHARTRVAVAINFRQQLEREREKEKRAPQATRDKQEARKKASRASAALCAIAAP